ncbi:glutamine-hydrolyzing carbamoyl-phosphate synthase small subunit [Desulfosarcina ovata]|uniref:Carbamoyl phosphate synthase small chain n=1 Tax=Desulfosarcina ovata subsp. ovata TaxID=2752305 RepID=A0A5K8ACX9_9BACT|nr:glutamine-hydrolyzing carbamoyl-phosphate synthase small subunit [Desulfosarcina ovata]BBO90379.1 carbamoyl-phosphate synthase small chain [Desulfosarcina ovata subsp. ovata]
MEARLTLEDGRTFPCRSFTGPGEASGEVVFNTSMTGYQEVLTDPSYSGQMVTMTYPLVGNYGVNPDDVESARIQVAAFLVKEYQPFPSNFRSTQSLADYLKGQGILGVEGLDTRALTRHIRNGGAMRAIISTQDLDPESLKRRANQIPSMEGMDLAKDVSTRRAYRWADGRPEALNDDARLDASVWRHRGARPSVVAIDFGLKYNIGRCLERAGFEVLVVPATTDAASIMAMAPDGLFLSNGPGDPEPVTYGIETTRELLGRLPIFGICLGNQILGLALGGRTYKLKFGHRGANQPVKNLDTGRVEITSQNHGFAVDMESLGNDIVAVTHINLNDNTVEGIRHRRLPAFAVQYHPEASPGPHDAAYLFDQFRAMMKIA